MALELFVSTNGNDGNNGSKQTPFATIGGVQSFIRKLKNTQGLPQGGITVNIMQGEYRLNNSLAFNENDAGTENSPIEYKAYDKHSVCLNGGLTLQQKDFTAIPEEIKKRLSNKKAKENVRQIDLKKYGLTFKNWGTLNAFGAYTTANKYPGSTNSMHCELFYNNERMLIARYPNDNYLNIESVINNGDASEIYENDKTIKLLDKWDNMLSPNGGTFGFNSKTLERVKNWQDKDDIWVYGFFKWDWADASTKVKSFDINNSTLTTEHAAFYGFCPGGRFYFYNILEELDMPGEWFLDRQSGILYFYPPSNDEKAEICLSILTDEIIKIDNAEHLTFNGFKIKCSRGNGINASGNNITVKNCILSNVGEGAINIKGENNIVDGCEIFRVGKYGITLDGGDFKTLTPSGNIASNNLIHNWSETVKTYQGGINLYGVGGKALNNHLYNSPHTAIFYKGNNHIMQGNHIHNVCLDTSDAGAIYSGRSYTWYGNIICNNYIHDIGLTLGDTHAIYFDDNLSGQKAYGNIIVNIRGAAFLIGGGREINLYNNLIINADKSIIYDDRGRDGLLNEGWYGNPLAPYSDEVKRLKEIDITSKIWAEQYPLLAKLKWDCSIPDGMEADEYFNDMDFAVNPAYSVIKDNVFYECEACWSERGKSISAYSDFAEENNLLIKKERE